MIRSVRLRNFKSARELSVPIGQLTIFAGHNGSGKSSVLQALACLKQSHLQGTSPAGLHVSGPLVQLGSAQDVLSEGATDEVVGVSLDIDGREYEWLCRAEQESNLLDFISRPPEVPESLLVANFQYLQADRIAPQTLFPRADVNAQRSGFLGVRGEYVVDHLATVGDRIFFESRSCPRESIGDSVDTQLQASPTNKLSDQVAGWFQRISPGVQLEAERVRGTDEVLLRFRYLGSRRGTSNRYRPTNVGFGLTYGLPILVACLSAPSGSLVLLENPEAHLHPRGQSSVGELLSRCATDGVQIMVETHSDHLLNGVRLAVKRGLIAPEKVRICYFQRDPISGDSYVSLPTIDSSGQISNWPPGFFDEWEKNLESLLS